MLDSCSRAEHSVESSSGERFLIKWYTDISSVEKEEQISMVFREEETTEEGIRYMSFTVDIGEVCIFLSKGQPFCVKASSYPGLKPNSIYVMTFEDFGVNLNRQGMDHLRLHSSLIGYHLLPSN
ncbi:hypothetical protein V5N11_029596 [Cardamine amara subsp. amara]|uniref:KIB1-4 beta-propeller domain-containing protein n=1 Tax=Cardamine amara subsp. amara TaxID=228776 RepID=A0ABD1AMB6_CARAN